MPVVPNGLELGLLVDLAYHVTVAGRTSPADDVADWLEAAGVADGERTSWRASPGVTLLVARKP